MRPDIESLRRLLLGVLVLGIVGTGTELLLLGHYEDRLQWTPLVLMVVGILAAILVGAGPGPGGVRFFRWIMMLFVGSGVLGIWLHLRGNAEFEREMYPSMAGLELLWESLRGATPALAPGFMAELGLLGLVYCYRHPAFRRGAVMDENE